MPHGLIWWTLRVQSFKALYRILSRLIFISGLAPGHLFLLSWSHCIVVRTVVVVRRTRWCIVADAGVQQFPNRKVGSRNHFQSWVQISFFSATDVSAPYVRHQLASLRILYPVETSQDRLALLFHQSVDHRLYRPHWGVVRLWKSMRINSTHKKTYRRGAI